MFCLFRLTAFAQGEDVLEPLDPGLNVEESEQLETIQWMQGRPFDLNEVTRESLCTIPGLDPVDAARVVDYRASNGPFHSEDQLLRIPDLDANTARWLQRFVVVRSDTRKSVKPSRVDLRTRTTQDLQLRKGHESSTYAGSPNKAYARLIGAIPGTGESGVLVEKDAGEPTGAGFVSGYLSMENIALLNQVVLGDFRFEAGQGLVFSQGAGYGKGGNPTEAGSKTSRGLVPHRSTDEFHFFRGVGLGKMLTINGVDVRFAAFYSNRKLPATIDEAGAVTSFYETGMFRTETELLKRVGVREQIGGGSLSADWSNRLSLGVAGYHHQFDRLVDANILNGTGGTCVGLNGMFDAGETRIDGEVAVGTGQGLAWVLRAVHRAGRSGSLVVLYRDYSPQFSGFHAGGFGERADTRNEQGFYAGVTVRPVTGMTASVFVDNFAFPQRTGTVPVPSHGHDVGLNMDVRISSNSDVSVRTTWSRSQVMATGTDAAGREVRFLTDFDQQRIRATFIHEVSRNVRLKTRFEGARIPGTHGVEDETGIMLFQDVRFSLRNDVTIEGRLVFFETDSYDTGIYEFENDVPGAFSVPVLYGAGRRWYLLAEYRPMSRLTFSLKFSETQKDGVNTLGSGLSEIQGDTESRITLQLDASF